MIDDVLNPGLYQALCRRFGPNAVRIKAPGEANSGRVVAQLNANGERRLVRKIDRPGEEYVINCPLCRDTRFRLSINHRWGVYDEETGSRNLGLIHCYNEYCFEDNYDAREQFYNQLCVYLTGAPSLAETRVKAGRAVTLGPVSPPGAVIPLRKLWELQPDHPAISYLRDERRYDIGELADIYRVGFCVESRHSLARNRIYIPIYIDGKYRGYQCRYPGDSVDGLTFKQAGVPKYFTAPNMRKSLLLYNYDVAKNYSPIVVVEGVTDAWRVGPSAVAVLGKTVSAPQAELLRKACRGDAGDPKQVVVLLDPTQDKKEKAKGRKHHIEVAAERLAEVVGRGDVLPVYLPDGSDPGSLSRLFIHKFIQREAARAGFELYVSAKGS